MGERQTEDLKVPGSIPGHGTFLFFIFISPFLFPSLVKTTMNRLVAFYIYSIDSYSKSSFNDIFLNKYFDEYMCNNLNNGLIEKLEFILKPFLIKNYDKIKKKVFL